MGESLKRQLIGSKHMIKQERGHAFNIDTVLLAHFLKIPYRVKQILDVGTGNGALALYLSELTSAKIIGIEIQEKRCQLARENVVLNSLEKQIQIVCQDYLTTSFHHVDVIVCNPPFFKVSENSRLNLDDATMMARHEVALSLEKLIAKVSADLKDGGKFFMIHRPSRLFEIAQLCHDHHLAIKRVRFVHPYLQKPANHVLIECRKNGEQEITLEAPLILYESHHEYTEEAKKIFME